MERNVIITGTSTGVGYECALLFSRNGYKVYATMRNIQKATDLQKRAEEEGLKVEIMALEVTDPKSIQVAIDKVIDQDGKIDLLINNAGAGFAKTTEQATVDEIRWITEVNYLGTVFCTQAVLPHMRKQKKGQIISVTSVGGLVGQPFNELYCGAKFAVEGYMEALATYVSDAFNIKFSCVEPGGITTAFLQSALGKTAVSGQLAMGDYQPIFERYMSRSRQRANEGIEQVYQTGLEVAQVILQIANNKNPPLRIRTSAWAEEFCALKTASDPDGTKLVSQIKANLL